MALAEFEARKERLLKAHEELIGRLNELLGESNGWYQRYRYPVLIAAHAPVFWRYDLDPSTNPFLMERIGVNAAFNVGAMEWNGNVVLMARVEGVDRKSFFAVAESGTGPAHAAPASCATLATDPSQGLNGAPGIKSAHH